MYFFCNSMGVFFDAKKKNLLNEVFMNLGDLGFEPRTSGLKGRCSTD